MKINKYILRFLIAITFSIDFDGFLIFSLVFLGRFVGTLAYAIIELSKDDILSLFSKKWQKIIQFFIFKLSIPVYMLILLNMNSKASINFLFNSVYGYLFYCVVMYVYDQFNFKKIDENLKSN